MCSVTKVTISKKINKGLNERKKQKPALLCAGFKWYKLFNNIFVKDCQDRIYIISTINA